MATIRSEGLLESIRLQELAHFSVDELPFAAGDATAGSEDELQAGVAGRHRMQPIYATSRRVACGKRKLIHRKVRKLLQADRFEQPFTANRGHRYQPARE